MASFPSPYPSHAGNRTHGPYAADRPLRAAQTPTAATTSPPTSSRPGPGHDLDRRGRRRRDPSRAAPPRPTAPPEDPIWHLPMRGKGGFRMARGCRAPARTPGPLTLPAHRPVSHPGLDLSTRPHGSPRPFGAEVSRRTRRAVLARPGFVVARDLVTKPRPSADHSLHSCTYLRFHSEEWEHRRLTSLRPPTTVGPERGTTPSLSPSSQAPCFAAVPP